MSISLGPGILMDLESITWHERQQCEDKPGSVCRATLIIKVARQKIDKACVSFVVNKQKIKVEDL